MRTTFRRNTVIAAALVATGAVALASPGMSRAVFDAQNAHKVDGHHAAAALGLKRHMKQLLWVIARKVGHDWAVIAVALERLALELGVELHTDAAAQALVQPRALVRRRRRRAPARRRGRRRVE